MYAAGDAAKLNGDDRERVGVHDLRHSFVGIARAGGLTLPEAAAAALHANPPVTAAVYAGLTGQAREQLPAKLAEAFEGCRWPHWSHVRSLPTPRTDSMI